MDTQQVATRLVELYNQGKAVQAEQELYLEDVTSYEQNPEHNAKGLEAVIAKTSAAFANIEEVFMSKAEEGKINNDSFLIIFHLDAKFKGAERMQMTEYGFYKVADGKIIEEYFFV